MKSNFIKTLVFTLSMGLFCPVTPGYVQAGEDLVFIVNEQTPATSLTRSDISNLFLKKRREWSDGTSVRFIDRKEGSLPRNIFLKQFLKRSTRDLDLYWIGQKLYSGDSAPIQVDNDTSVMAFVASLKGAMGYVNSGTPLIEGVKKIEIKNPSSSD